MQRFVKISRSCFLLLTVGCLAVFQVQAAEPQKNPNAAASAAATTGATANAAAAEKPKVAQFCWTELATNNVQAAKDFYAKVFGWKFKEHPVGDMTYTMVNINDKEFAGIWAIPKDQEKQIPAHWLAYILVENLEQSLDKATKNGATIIRPITQAGEYGRLAIIKDPTGAEVALWQTLKEKS